MLGTVQKGVCPKKYSHETKYFIVVVAFCWPCLVLYFVLFLFLFCFVLFFFLGGGRKGSFALYLFEFLFFSFQFFNFFARMFQLKGNPVLIRSEDFSPAI